MTIGDVAGLIQAVGSIAAIIAAFWIGSAQGRLAVQMRQADRAERLDAIATILGMAHVGMMLKPTAWGHRIWGHSPISPKMPSLNLACSGQGWAMMATKTPHSKALRGFLGNLGRLWEGNWSPRQESNLYLALRRRLFYPLNYGERIVAR